MVKTSLLAALALVMLTGAAPPRWTIDPKASSIGFAGTVYGQGFSGRFERFSADIRFDPADPATGTAVVLIDLASARTGDATRDATLPGADWFDAARTPQARFEARRFSRAASGGGYVAAGTLTIRGIARPLTLPFTLVIAGSTARMTARLTLDRSQWGIGQGQFKSGEVVALAVPVTISLTATR